MKDTILALLLTMFPGVRKDGLMQLARTLALQCATEDDAKGLVSKLTKAQVDDYVKDYRADVDKEVTDSNKAFENNLRRKYNLEKEPEPGGQKKQDDDGKPDLASLIKSAIAEAVNPLQEKLNKYEKDGIVKTRLQTLNEKLSACKDDNFKTQVLKDFGRMDFTDEEFNEYLAEKETAIVTANQNIANAALGAQDKPIFAQKEDSGVSKGVADYVASLKPDSKKLSGKEV